MKAYSASRGENTSSERTTKMCLM